MSSSLCSTSPSSRNLVDNLRWLYIIVSYVRTSFFHISGVVSEHFCSWASWVFKIISVTDWIVYTRINFLQPAGQHSYKTDTIQLANSEFTLIKCLVEIILLISSDSSNAFNVIQRRAKICDILYFSNCLYWYNFYLSCAYLL